MTTTEPADPPPRPGDSEGAGAAPDGPDPAEHDTNGSVRGQADTSASDAERSDTPRADHPARRRGPKRELTPEELQQQAERKAERQQARREERRAARQAARQAKREAQWDEALNNARAAKAESPTGPSASGRRSGSDGEPVTVYEGTTGGLPPIRPYLHQLRKRRGLIWHLARSELKGENYNTFFGQLWLILSPLMLAAVYVLGRSVIRPMGSPAERNFLICHLVGGVFLFQFTAKTMNAGSRSILSNKNMVLNTSFARSVFPLATLLRSVFDLIPLMLTLFVVRIIFDQPTTWVYVFLPVVIGVQLLFNAGLAFGTAMLMVFFRDFGNVLGFSSRLWLWMTPVLYTTAEIPESIRWVLELNPLYPLFAMYEQIFVGEVPSIGYFLWALAWAVPVLVAGVILFIRKERDFAVRL